MESTQPLAGAPPMILTDGHAALDTAIGDSPVLFLESAPDLPGGVGMAPAPRPRPRPDTLPLESGSITRDIEAMDVPTVPVRREPAVPHRIAGSK